MVGLDDRTALRAAQLLANGMGGLDWAGLPIVATHLGVADLEALLDRLEVILQYKSPESRNPGEKLE